MKTSLVKWLFIAGSLLFADWLIMILFGCAAHLCRADEVFFCSTYCFVGIGILIITLLLIFGLTLFAREQKK